ncbi:uncharacterized protein LOC117113957 [Anneissia japonica]|uniref:uncharacterized protein LOC117113957 n=1 Tax=Anneissia japonica TaxID=1529436 RepID=UPI001425AE4C|nr:uncharacterized protein LOC117113957 [Anneissia japonica]
MSTAHFTTKISAHLHPMTELVELPFPQRVRIPSIDPRRPNIKAEKIISLLGIEKEFHVITTRPGIIDEVLRIPSKIPIKMALVAGNFQLASSSLPGVYALVNPTWHIHEMGRPTLPAAFQQFPQPLHDVLTPWMRTFEG